MARGSTFDFLWFQEQHIHTEWNTAATINMQVIQIKKKSEYSTQQNPYSISHYAALWLEIVVPLLTRRTVNGSDGSHRAAGS